MKYIVAILMTILSFFTTVQPELIGIIPFDFEPNDWGAEEVVVEVYYNYNCNKTHDEISKPGYYAYVYPIIDGEARQGKSYLLFESNLPIYWREEKAYDKVYDCIKEYKEDIVNTYMPIIE